MKKQATKYYILLLLASMFAAPGIAAYLFYQHPNWLNGSKINKGTLLTPPVALKDFDKHAKWRIVLYSSDQCKQDCLEQLNLLSRVRLALGRKLYLVDQWLIFGDKAPSDAEDIKHVLQEQDVHVARLSSIDTKQFERLSPKASVFLVNPDSYLVLGYQAGANPDDLYKDLKLLLNTTENKSG